MWGYSTSESVREFYDLVVVMLLDKRHGDDHIEVFRLRRSKSLAAFLMWQGTTHDMPWTPSAHEAWPFTWYRENEPPRSEARAGGRHDNGGLRGTPAPCPLETEPSGAAVSFEGSRCLPGATLPPAAVIGATRLKLLG